MKVPYIGKSEYCYSNSTAMLLASIGEDIDPALIEVLTGMGMGAFLDKQSNFLFFDCYEPDKGVSTALTTLGFEFDERHTDDPNKPPFEELKSILKNRPAILGPFDFGKIVYNPEHINSGGSDHYVLAYDADEIYIYINDPWGFPCVPMTYSDLQEAWKAEAVEYKRGYYRYWYNPRRVKTPGEDELFSNATATYKYIYKDSQAAIRQQGSLTGPEAIRTFSKQIRQQIVDVRVIEFLTGFSFPVSARRALDYASFFDGHLNELSELKNEQASHFGFAQNFAMKKEVGSPLNKFSVCWTFLVHVPFEN